MRSGPNAHRASIFLLVTILLSLHSGTLSQVALAVVPTEEGSSQEVINRAARAVDDAWEEFHQAAIGGTLASPVIQTKIESQLHEARALLMEARKAERKRDHQSVKIITNKLFVLSNQIVQASREKKQ